MINQNRTFDEATAPGIICSNCLGEISVGIKFCHQVSEWDEWGEDGPILPNPSAEANLHIDCMDALDKSVAHMTYTGWISGSFTLADLTSWKREFFIQNNRRVAQRMFDGGAWKPEEVPT